MTASLPVNSLAERARRSLGLHFYGQVAAYPREWPCRAVLVRTFAPYRTIIEAKHAARCIADQFAPCGSRDWLSVEFGVIRAD